ncbi:MAG: hypothetical protein ACRDQG_03695 [Pseudonocardiaceae bacterium]
MLVHAIECPARGVVELLQRVVPACATWPRGAARCAGRRPGHHGRIVGRGDRGDPGRGR